MPEREFEITIEPGGKVELHIKGYKGKACLEMAKVFEDMVGEIAEQRETAEFYEPDQQVGIHVEGNRH